MSIMMKSLPSTLVMTLAALSCLFAGYARGESVLDKQVQLEAQTFWANRDFDWYKANIPFFDCPDPEIVTTYYYRWELVTRHITYGSPNTGYTLTEFANRPFWSGRYGAIACPSGHQAYEVRWLRDPLVARDFLRYWFRTPGAQPRNYSSWLADSTWATHQVHPDDAFVLDLLPDLVEHHKAWRRRQWVPDMGLFWQLGHDDGMEFDINAQQTKNILRGGQSLRPSFNAYMWADLQALARMAELAGDREQADEFRSAADGIQDRLQELLWDPDRLFFFPMSNQRHEKNGHVVEKHTLTYESGEFAGSPHGRELHGYVPWAFSMPDAGFEDAWKFLMDPAYFYSEFGPTTVEREDPLFALKKGCCWWCGQSWPFATTQTLKAMANVLQSYEQEHVTRDNYVHLLRKFAVSQRKDGRPYIAEALNPFDGSWRHHDMRNRSEHYFHSGFVDLVITGLVGLIPQDDDRLVIDPLASEDWDYFALEDVPYKGHLLSIIWDRSGDRYPVGRGLHVLVNGKPVAFSKELGRIEVKLPSVRQVPLKEARLQNFAVSNDGDYYPRWTASFVSADSALSLLSDGQRRYDNPPLNRWTAAGSPNKADWVEIDLGTSRAIERARVYPIDDGKVVVAPGRMHLQYADGDVWKAVSCKSVTPTKAVGGQPTTFELGGFEAQRFRVLMEHAEGGAPGLTEIELWGRGELPYVAPRPPAGYIAYSRDPSAYPKATASHSDIYGGTPEKAIDGRIVYQANPINRWTSYGSPNKTDWLEVDLGQPKQIGRVELLIYNDHGGVQPPSSYTVQYFDGGKWLNARNAVKNPAEPRGNISNSVSFDPVRSSKVRVVFTHDGKARSGVTEMEVWRQ